MSVKDVQATLGRLIENIAHEHRDFLGPVSDRFVNEAVMLARELESERNDIVVIENVRKLIRTRYERLSSSQHDLLWQEIAIVVIRHRERRVQ